MPVDHHDELLELQERGLELAIQEREERRADVMAILNSRPVLLAVRDDRELREIRLELLEELTRVSYPSATIVAAARHLATAAGSPRRRRSRPSSRRWSLIAVVTWAWALVFLASGTGMSALGAHFTNTKLLVWSIFGVITILGHAGYKRFGRWSATSKRLRPTRTNEGWRQAAGSA